MNWTRISDYCIKCEPYSICKVWQGGVVSYELWRGKQRLSSHATADEAKAAVREAA